MSKSLHRVRKGENERKMKKTSARIKKKKRKKKNKNRQHAMMGEILNGKKKKR